MALLPRAVVEAIVLSEGTIGSARAVAGRLGLTNRFTLARLLKREGLPPLHRFAHWVMIESWLRRAEEGRMSLSQLALRRRRHSSSWYRLIKEITGMSWEQLQRRGLVWFHAEFAKELTTWQRSEV